MLLNQTATREENCDRFTDRFAACLQDFNVQLLCYWGLMCLINGRSDTLSIS